MHRIQADVQITAIKLIADETYSLIFRAPELASLVRPGQFINIRVDAHFDPLLRRPYSISNVYADTCEIVFTVVGKGTKILSEKKIGDMINIIGPLGNTFGYEKVFTTAVIVAGGIGVAPFPFLIRALQQRERIVHTFLGARNRFRIIRDGLPNLRVATDDGSEGFHGTVIDALEEFWSSHTLDTPMIFACGPNKMLQATQRFAAEKNIPCELSLESEMACGVGICQGCPIERTAGERKYALVCTDGPCFDSQNIIFHEHA